MTKTRKILGIVLALIVLTLAMSISIFATDSEEPTKGYDIVIYNEDGTEAMTINGQNSGSEFDIVAALENAYTFGNNAVLFGITGNPTYELVMYEDEVLSEDLVIPEGRNVVINVNGHDITSDEFSISSEGSLVIKDTVGGGSVVGYEYNNETGTFEEAQAGLKGTGTEVDPFLIEDLDDLIWFRDQVDLQLADGSTQFAGKYFKLTADIDLAGINWNPIGSMTGDHGSFKGVFDGNGHTISNLYVEQAGTGLGLFARTAGNAVIKNVNLDNVTIKSTDNSNYAGGLVGNAYASTYIENVHVTGNVYISGRGYIGGIAGHGYVVMDNVSVVANEGSVITSSFWCCGGILGYGGEGVTDISNAHVEGVTITSAAGGLGAIVGMAEDNNGTQPISGSNLSAKNVEIKTYVGAYGEAYANYALGYLYGGNPTSELTGTLEVEDVKIETSTGEAVQVNDAVASVNGAIYFSFADAFANANGGTVVLLNDITIDTETITIADGVSVTLDMNGKTITVVDNKASDVCYELFYIYGELTVTGNGTIKLTSNSNDTVWAKSSSIFHNRGGVLTIENGTFEHLGGTCMAFVVDNSGNWFGDATTNIYDGTLTSTYIAIRNRMEQNSHGASGTAILNITGGTINGTSRAIWAQAASTSTTSPATGLINVSGGNIGLIDTARSAGAECMTTISGGTVAAFKGEVGELTVTGGTLDNVTILTASGEAADYVINANGTYVLAVAKIGDVNYETYEEAFAAAVNGDVVEILVAGEFTPVVADGLVAIKNLDGHYVIGKEPTATVNDMGPMLIPAGDYMVYGNGDNTADMPLSFVMQFLADQDAEDMANSPYSEWYGDFVITFTGIENGSFTADGCYLAGHYGSFGWVKVPVDDMEIEEGVRYPVMLGVGMGQKYDYICSSVEDFKCALYLTPEVLAENPSIQVTLELAVVDNSQGEDAAASALVSGENTYNVTDYSYDAEDFVEVKAVASVTDSNGKVTNYLSLQEAIAYANENGGTVTLLGNIELDAPIVVTGTVVLDLAGYTINYTSTVQGEAMITNKGNLTINDSSENGTGVINYDYVGAADSSFGKGNYTISNGGTLTVNGGKITIANLRAHAKYPIDNNSTTGDAILVINGGHLYNYNTSAIRMFCNSTTNKNSVTINGGLIEGYCSIWVQNPGKNTVNGQLSITGGEIKTTAAAYVNGTAELKDVSSRIYFSIDGEGGAWSTDSSVSITGGTFYENVNLAEEVPANITIDETAPVFKGYVKLPMTPVASVNGVEYGTLQEAIDAANPDDTVVLLDNITVTEGYVIDKSIIIDLNGKTVALENSDESVNCLFNIVGDNVSVAISNGTLTVEYGQVIYVGKNDSDVASNPTVSLDSVTLTGANYGLTVAGNGIVNINANTTITGAVEAVRVFDDAKATIVAGATITCTDASKSAVMAYGNATVTISGGNFNGAIVETENATVEITGGSFSVDPSDLVIDGYVAIANLDGIYVVGEKPTATVNDYGPTIIPGGEYGVWDGKNYTSTSTADMPLSFVMQFIADQTAADMANSPYADWYADFVITFDGLEDNAFIADGCYLAGYYGDFGWVKIPVDGMTIKEGVRYPVMLGVGLGQKYDYVCSGVKDFKCALYITPEILEANPDLTVNLELAVVDNSKGQDAAAEAMVNDTAYNVTDYDYVAEDFIVDYVAAVGNKQFTSLAEAIAYANANGGTVTLLDDIALTEGIIIVAGKEITLDLNGKILSYTSDVAGEDMIVVKGKLIIDDSVGNGKITYVNTDTTGANVTVSTISAEAGSTLVINNGIIENKTVKQDGSSIYSFAIDMLTNGSLGDVSVTINDGTVYSDYMAIRQFNNGDACKNTLVVNGGYIYGARRAIQIHFKNNAAYLTITDGKIEGGNYSLCFLTTSENLSVTGGEFIGDVWYSGATGFISGGTFDNPVYEAYCAEGYVPVDNGDGTYGVKEGSYVAELNGTKYESLQEAIAYANANGGTVTLLGNIELSESIKVTGTVTLDLNGYTITGTDNNVTGNFYLIDNVGTLTVTDSSEDKTGKITLEATTDRNWSNSSVVIANNPGGKLTVESGTIEHLGGTDMAYAIDNLTNGKGTYAETVINGGTIKSAYIAIRQFLNGIEATNKLTINAGTIDGGNSTIYFQSPSANANTGTLIVKAEAVLTNRVYLGITDGTTEWPVEVSIAAGAFAEDVATKIAHDTIPDGYEIVETNGIIGVEEKAEEKIDVKYFNVDLGTDLAINFAYVATDFDEDLGNYYAVIKKCHIEGCDHTSQTYYVSGESFYLDSNGYVQVKASSIAASEMVCDIEITIYKGTYTTAEDGTVTENGVAVSNTYTSSVVKFVESAIDVYASIDNKEELYALMADMLVYGAEAQKVFKHTNTVLATEFSTKISEFVEQYSTEYDDEGNYVVPDMEKSVTTEESTKYYAGFNVDLEHTIFLNLYFQGVDMSNDFDAKIKFTHHNGDVHEYSVKAGTLNWKNNNGFLQVNIDDLAPADLRLDVECIVLVPNSEGVLTEASKVILSVEDYVAAAKASGKTDGIYDAILRYADSAEAYFYPAN